MKVVLCFKQLQLGELSFQNGLYEYNSNLNGENEFKNYLNSANYGLFSSNGKKSAMLFEPFAKIVKDIKQRPDLMKFCSLDENSSDYEILCEYAKTNQFDAGFHLKLKK